MTKDIEHMYNITQHLILTVGHLIDTNQRMMRGEASLINNMDLEKLAVSMRQKAIDIEMKFNEGKKDV